MRWILVMSWVCGCTGGLLDKESSTETGTDASTPQSDARAYLLVIDNSESMLEEAFDLAVAAGQANFPEDSLVAVTTTDGTGTLMGAVVDKDHGVAVQQQILCGATCIPAQVALPVDPTYVCGDPFTLVTEEVMGCLCPTGWVGRCGSGNEQGLESAYQGLQLMDLPEDYRANLAVFSDEGDGSVLLSTGDPGVGPYEDLLAGSVFHAVVPDLDALGSIRCPGTGADWGVQRYQAMATLTDGLFLSLYDASCDTSDLAASLETILAAGR